MWNNFRENNMDQATLQKLNNAIEKCKHSIVHNHFHSKTPLEVVDELLTVKESTKETLIKIVLKKHHYKLLHYFFTKITNDVELDEQRILLNKLNADKDAVTYAIKNKPLARESATKSMFLDLVKHMFGKKQLAPSFEVREPYKFKNRDKKNKKKIIKKDEAIGKREHIEQLEQPKPFSIKLRPRDKKVSYAELPDIEPEVDPQSTYTVAESSVEAPSYGPEVNAQNSNSVAAVPEAASAQSTNIPTAAEPKQVNLFCLPPLAPITTTFPQGMPSSFSSNLLELTSNLVSDECTEQFWVRPFSPTYNPLFRSQRNGNNHENEPPHQVEFSYSSLSPRNNTIS